MAAPCFLRIVEQHQGRGLLIYMHGSAAKHVHRPIRCRMLSTQVHFICCMQQYYC